MADFYEHKFDIGEQSILNRKAYEMMNAVENEFEYNELSDSFVACCVGLAQQLGRIEYFEGPEIADQLVDMVDTIFRETLQRQRKHLRRFSFDD